MDAKKNMSQRVKAYRKSKYNSIEAFSEDLGIALNTVRKLERAHGNPTMDTMNLVADKLGITVSELLSPPASGQEQKQSIEKSLCEVTKSFMALPDELQKEACEHFSRLVEILKTSDSQGD